MGYRSKNLSRSRRKALSAKVDTQDALHGAIAKIGEASRDIKSLNEKVDVAVILAWIHAKNIIRNNCDYIHQGGRFVTVWPSVEEINRDNYLSYIES